MLNTNVLLIKALTLCWVNKFSYMNIIYFVFLIRKLAELFSVIYECVCETLTHMKWIVILYNTVNDVKVCVKLGHDLKKKKKNLIYGLRKLLSLSWASYTLVWVRTSCKTHARSILIRKLCSILFVNKQFKSSIIIKQKQKKQGYTLGLQFVHKSN